MTAEFFGGPWDGEVWFVKPGTRHLVYAFGRGMVIAHVYVPSPSSPARYEYKGVEP